MCDSLILLLLLLLHTNMIIFVEKKNFFNLEKNIEKPSLWETLLNIIKNVILKFNNKNILTTKNLLRIKSKIIFFLKLRMEK